MNHFMSLYIFGIKSKNNFVIYRSFLDILRLYSWTQYYLGLYFKHFYFLRLSKFIHVIYSSCCTNII